MSTDIRNARMLPEPASRCEPAGPSTISGLKLAVAVRSHSLEEQLFHALKAAGVKNASALSARTDPPPHACLIETGPSFAAAAEQAQAWYPACTLIAVLPGAGDADVILQAFRSGAQDFLAQPLEKELLRALSRLLDRSGVASGAPHGSGSLIGFLSAKGGCGATTIACHVAHAMADSGAGQVLLADLDPHAGIIGLLTKASSRYSIVDAAQNLHRLDRSLWNGFVVTRQALDILPTSQAGWSSEQCPPETLANLLPFFRSQYDFALFDLGRGMNASAAAIAHLMDQLVLVTSIEVPSLWAAARVSDAVQAAGFPSSRIRLVLNRVGPLSASLGNRVSDWLNLPVYARLPGAYRQLQDSTWEGTLLRGKKGLGGQFAELAAQLQGAARGRAEENSNGLARSVRERIGCALLGSAAG